MKNFHPVLKALLLMGLPTLFAGRTMVQTSKGPDYYNPDGTIKRVVMASEGVKKVK